MCAREVFLGAHVQIVVGCAIQYSVDTCHRCNLDGAGRQTGILIGVIRTVELQHVVVNTLDCEIFQGKLDGRVSLKWHVCFQSVQIHTCNHWLLGIVGSLLIDDAGQCANLIFTQFQGLGLQGALYIPEILVLLLHAFHQILYRDIPINLVGVGDEQAGDSGCVVTLLRTERRIAEQDGYSNAVHHQFA